MKKCLSVLLAALLAFASFALAPNAQATLAEVASYEEMVEFIRAGLLAHKTTLRFLYTGDDYRAPAIDDICACGADPAAGDYLRLSFNGALPTVTPQEDGSYTVTAAFYTTAQQEAAVDAYVAAAMAGCTAETPLEKTQYIYMYLCENVLFDLENLYNEEDLLKYTAYGAFTQGKAVCQGFAALFYRMALAAGLECRVVTGMRAGESHAWNIVKLDGVWYHTDAACGAQVLDPAGYFMQPLFNGYTVGNYGTWTDAQIEDYLFTDGGDTPAVSSGALSYGISWTLDRTSGELVIEGEGELRNAANFLINRSPFKNNPDIRTAVFCEGITMIPFCYFEGCDNLEEIRLPASVTRIGVTLITGTDPVLLGTVDFHFTECPSLKRLVVDENNPVFHMQNNCLIRTEERTLVDVVEPFEIPSDGSVTKIAKSALRNTDGLTDFTVPDFITSIGGFAFENCRNLTRIKLPEDLPSIGERLFFGCTRLTEITIPDSVTSIGHNAFRDCTGLTGITIPDSVTSIDNYAFVGCTGLTGITIPDSVTSIGFNAFKNCTGLIWAVLPDDDVKISSKVFEGCTNLRWAYIPGYSEKSDVGSTFSGCDSLETVIFGGGVGSIPDDIFSPSSNVRSVFVLNEEATCSETLSTYIPNAVIYGYAGSAIETAAAAAGLPFTAIPLCPETNAPHDVAATDDVPPTCTESAVTPGVCCRDCGETFAEPNIIGDPLGHAPGDAEEENRVEPTCTTEGSYDSVVRCQRCGKALSSVHEKLAMAPHADNDRNGYCDDCGEYICVHAETALVNDAAPGCTAGGYSGDTVCLICGVTLEYGVTLPANGHTPILSKAAKPATCLTPGYTAEYTCASCGTVTSASIDVPVSSHADGNGDGLCDLCRAPMDCTVYGICGGSVFWHIAAGTLVITGNGETDAFGANAPWAAFANGIDTVYITENVSAVDGASFDGIASLGKVFAPAGAAVSNCGKPTLTYTCTGGTVTVTDSAGYTVYDILNAAYVFCADRTVSSLRFQSLRLNGTDGRSYTEYDILRSGKIIDENHFRLPSGAVITDVAIRPLGYASFNSVLAALGKNPDRNLILSITCTDLLPDALKAEANAYAEQMVIHFVDEEPPETPSTPQEPPTPQDPPGGNEPSSGSGQSFIERFKATLAAILAVFKKLLKFFSK